MPDAATGDFYNAIFGYLSGYYFQTLTSLNFKIGTGFSGIDENLADTQAETIVIADRANGVLSVAASSDIASVEAFTLDGRRVAFDIQIDGTRAGAPLANLPAGITLVKVTLADGSVSSAKVVR